MNLIHDFLDERYGADGAEKLRQMLQGGADPDSVCLSSGETPLHVATRRRRVDAIEILLQNGANIDAKNRFGKTCFVHALRRGFDDVVTLLRKNGAVEVLNGADSFAVAMVEGRLEDASALLAADPSCIRTGNPEEDRLLADLAGRPSAEPVKMLVEAGADLSAPALDDGTPLHQAAWFGQPANAEILVEAGAPLEVFDKTHFSSPLGWAVHGSRYSGGAREVQENYETIVTMLLAKGALLHYPGEPESDAYLARLKQDATPTIAKILASHS